MNFNVFDAINSNTVENNKTLGGSLAKLSSGLKINKASDDASGLSISDKLRTQASGIKQGIDNANSAVSMLQMADKAMAELSNILNLIKIKAIQMSTETTSEEGKSSIKTEILKLIENYDSIVCSTSYNDIHLLSGCASPFNFQVGDKAMDVINVNVDSVDSRQMGQADPYKLKNFITGFNEIATTPTTLGSAGDGLILENDLSNLTHGNSNAAGNFMVEIPSGTKNLTLYLYEHEAKDTMQIFTKDGKHVAGTPAGDSTSWQSGGYSPEDIISLNPDKFNLGATYQDALGTYQLNSTTDSLGDSIVNYIDKNGDNQIWTMGPYDEMVVIPEVNEDLVVFINGNNSSVYDTSAEWKSSGVASDITTCACDAENLIRNDDNPILLIQAQKLLAVIDEALTQLNTQRSNIGSGTNQLESATRNLMTSYTNIKSAESVIRDVDYAEESATFNKSNIISQAGTFTQTQANETMQNVLKLLK